MTSLVSQGRDVIGRKYIKEGNLKER